VGNYSVRLSDFSAQQTSGVYFYTLKAGDFIKSKKMILIRVFFISLALKMHKKEMII